MRGKSYTVYTIISTFLEEAAVAGIVLWLLPRFGIDIPLWGLAIIMAAVAVYSYITYRLCKKTLDEEPVTPLSALIGLKGMPTTRIDPKGVVRVHGVLWKARASSSIDKDEEVVVVGRERLTLIVARSVNNSHQADR